MPDGELSADGVEPPVTAKPKAYASPSPIAEVSEENGAKVEKKEKDPRKIARKWVLFCCFVFVNIYVCLFRFFGNVSLLWFVSFWLLRVSLVEETENSLFVWGEIWVKTREIQDLFGWLCLKKCWKPCKRTNIGLFNYVLRCCFHQAFGGSTFLFSLVLFIIIINISKLHCDLCFCLRYQLELCKKAMEENIIVYLETGCGKTHIAVLLIYELAHLIRKPQQKICIFLAPTVALVQQVGYFLWFSDLLMIRFIILFWLSLGFKSQCGLPTLSF